MNDFERGLSRYFTEEQLQKVRRVSIGIAGVGGLGSNAAMLLVRCGFRRFVLADHDRISTDNLNRQNFFAAQIGKTKVEALAENLSAINEALSLKTHEAKISAENIEEIFSACDIIVEALDDVKAKLFLVERLVGSGKTVVAASGIAGFGGSDRIVTRRINDHFYVVGDFMTDVAEAPPYAPCVMIAAAKQADVVLEIVLGGTEKDEENRDGKF